MEVQRGAVSFLLSSSYLEAKAGLKPHFSSFLAQCSMGLHTASKMRGRGVPCHLHLQVYILATCSSLVMF